VRDGRGNAVALRDVRRLGEGEMRVHELTVVGTGSEISADRKNRHARVISSS
jgi:hypothetical protein